MLCKCYKYYVCYIQLNFLRRTQSQLHIVAQTGKNIYILVVENDTVTIYKKHALHVLLFISITFISIFRLGYTKIDKHFIEP